MNVPLDNSTALRNDLYHGWMSPPKTRATTDILWTCLATIILCVYTAIHLNLPDPQESARRQAFRRAKWVVIAILAPEIVLQAAYKQFDDARQLQHRLKEWAATHNEGKETLEHSNLDCETAEVSENPVRDTEANIHIPKAPTKVAIREVEEIPHPEDITLVYAFYAVMGGFRLKVNHGEHAGQSFTVTPQAVDEFAQAGFFWNISTKSIEDKSKANHLAKILTVVQVLGMLVQCAARKAQDLPLSLLEIHTFIHAVCAAIMFVLWFYKPMDIQDATYRVETVYIRDLVKDCLVPDQDSRLESRRVNYGRTVASGVSLSERIDQYKGHDFGFKQIFESANSENRSYQTTAMFVSLQAIYGCLHMIAWNSHLPSLVEKWLWRTSCIYIAAFSFVFIMSALVTSGLTDLLEERGFLWHDEPLLSHTVFYSFMCLSFLGLIALIAARIFIVVESLISLRSVPIGVYAAVQWSDYIPHI